MPLPTVVANAAPSAMKAPARTDRTKMSSAGIAAFATPTDSALRATSTGGRASRPVAVNGACVEDIEAELWQRLRLATARTAKTDAPRRRSDLQPYRLAVACASMPAGPRTTTTGRLDSDSKPR